MMGKRSGRVFDDWRIKAWCVGYSNTPSTVGCYVYPRAVACYEFDWGHWIEYQVSCKSCVEEVMMDDG